MRILFLPFALFCLLMVQSISSHAATQEDILDSLANGKWDRAHLFASKGGDPFIRALAEWYYLRRSDVIAPYQQYQKFLQAHPDWPDKDSLKKRMEIAFLNSEPSDEILIRWFATNKPVTSRGLLLKLIAEVRLTDQKLHTLWIESDLSKKEEEMVLAKYSKALTSLSHEMRTDRLLWEGQTKAAERMLKLLPNDIQKLSRARIKLRRNESGVDSYVDAVPAALASHPGLLFERAQWRAKRGNYKGVEEILLQAPARLPYAHLWWNYQNRVIRDAIEDKEYKTAKTLIDKHSQIKAVPRVEAEWLRGWLHYAFLNSPKTAATAFENIYHTASMPISRSRGSYWAARAYEDAGQRNKAVEWYKTSALFPTTFYGQLAHQYLQRNAPLPIPPFLPPADTDIERFVAATPLAAQFRKLSRTGHAHLIWPMIEEELLTNNVPEYFARFATLARLEGNYPMAIKISQEALNKGLYLNELFPIIPVQKNLAIDPAFALAITRQESRFDIKARSSADARGLMQLLPSTASRVARSHNIPYVTSRLYQPRYNMELGSLYMAGLLDRFRGSYILSIAGYNAGPSRSDQWMERFGTLSSGDYKRNIQWMEMIPFNETRNYVQRVLENYHVYRHILSQQKPNLKAEQILTKFSR